MSGSTGTLWRVLREAAEGSPLSVVLYPSLGALEDIIDTVLLIAPGTLSFARTRSVEDAFEKLDLPLLLTPEDEPRAIEILDGQRDALLARSAPVILFILKDGSAETALRTAPGLAGWLRGRVFDPEPEALDVENERRRFEEATGKAPRSWLEAWHRGDIADTLDNNLLYQRALLLGDA